MTKEQRTRSPHSTFFSSPKRPAAALASSSSHPCGPLERLEKALQRPGPSHLLERLRREHLSQLLLVGWLVFFGVLLRERNVFRFVLCGFFSSLRLPLLLLSPPLSFSAASPLHKLTCCCICAICCGLGPPRLPALLLIAFISPPWPLFPTIVARIRMYSPTSSATASGWHPDPWATRQMREGSWRILGLVESSSCC